MLNNFVFDFITDIHVITSSSNSIVLQHPKYNKVSLECTVDYLPESILETFIHSWKVLFNNTGSQSLLVNAKEAVKTTSLNVSFNVSGLHHIECAFILKIKTKNFTTLPYIQRIPIYVKGLMKNVFTSF